MHILSLLRPATARHPLYSHRVACGFPSPAQDHVEKRLSLDELLGLHAPHIYLVRAEGHSMEGLAIYDGDLLVVDKSKTAQAGNIVVAALHGEPLVKQLRRHGRYWALHSAHPDYPPVMVEEEEALNIWGVVRYSLRQHDE